MTVWFAAVGRESTRASHCAAGQCAGTEVSPLLTRPTAHRCAAVTLTGVHGAPFQPLTLCRGPPPGEGAPARPGQERRHPRTVQSHLAQVWGPAKSPRRNSGVPAVMRQSLGQQAASAPQQPNAGITGARSPRLLTRKRTCRPSHTRSSQTIRSKGTRASWLGASAPVIQ